MPYIGKIFQDQVLTAYKVIFLLYHGQDLRRNTQVLRFMVLMELDQMISLKGTLMIVLFLLLHNLWQK